MKRLLLCTAFALCILASGPLRSQDDLTPLHGIAAKLLFIDYNTPNSVDGFKLGNGIELGYLRRIDPNMSFGVPLKIGVVNIDGNENKTTFVSLDLTGQYQFSSAENKFRPFIMAGIGFVSEELENNNAQVPVGLGFNLRVGESSFITFQGEYRKSFKEQRDNIQIGLGWFFKLKPNPLPPKPLDTDGDGIPDEQDHCPDEPGTLLANGCPDTDGDGVPNGEDDCPTVKGPASNRGCPTDNDRDGDGIPDDEDECPDEPGTLALKGCPPAAPQRPTASTIDRDGDGVVDEKDRCPDEPGPITLLGCPDRDGDGIPDIDDRCPDEPGLPVRKGCPPKDSDGDGVLDEDDDCPDVPGKVALKGCPDRDGDNIPDHLDECPDMPGKASAKGCPDADGDGVPDHLDECPNQPGLPEHKGCPFIDTDGDGIPDKEDRCPNQKGPAETQGCPDSDGDGVPDLDDLCPNEPGLASAKGCPDADGDGTPDHLDKCPDEKGTNQGCPDIEKEDKEYLAFAAKNVQFETGRSTLKAQSYTTLAKVAEIMNKYPRYHLSIEGHTDNVGDATANQRLSEERAQSCYEYLLSRGVPPLRMMYKGFGKNKPLADNNTAEGREKNRRVEFNMYIK